MLRSISRLLLLYERCRSFFYWKFSIKSEAHMLRIRTRNNYIKPNSIDSRLFTVVPTHDNKHIPGGNETHVRYSKRPQPLTQVSPRPVSERRGNTGVFLRLANS